MESNEVGEHTNGAISRTLKEGQHNNGEGWRMHPKEAIGVCLRRSQKASGGKRIRAGERREDSAGLCRKTPRELQK